MRVHNLFLRCRLFLGLLAVFSFVIAPVSHRSASGVWGTRPLLSYFALTQSLEGPFRRGAGLTDEQFSAIERIAYLEYNCLQSLYRRSQSLLSGDDPLWWKRWLVFQMGYNRQVDAIVAASDTQLKRALDASSYRRVVDWIEARWPVEKRLNIGKLAGSDAAAPRTYRVYATRYDSGGRYTAALPDKCVKFTNGGNRICEEYGYQVGVRYEIFITYQKSTGVTVAESGPWNVDDTYWSSWNDPTPRRMFADVGLGIPEAQAAYFNGYNGGKDQFGRKVSGPYGIDLAREVSVDIGLKPGKNDWVTVTFQWTAGWGSGGGNPAPAGTANPGATGQSGDAQAIVPVEVATPNQDGSIVHTVQPGQTLWDIATAYEITLPSLYSLNNLDEKSVIWPGDELVIRLAQPTSTGGAASLTPVPPTLTPRIIDATGTAWAAQAFGTQAVETVMAQIYTAQTPTAQASAGASQPLSPVLVISLVALVLGAALLLVGRLLRKEV